MFSGSENLLRQQVPEGADKRCMLGPGVDIA